MLWGARIAVASLYVKAAKSCFCVRFLQIVQIIESITYAESEAYGRANPSSSASLIMLPSTSKHALHAAALTDVLAFDKASAARECSVHPLAHPKQEDATWPTRSFDFLSEGQLYPRSRC